MMISLGKNQYFMIFLLVIPFLKKKKINDMIKKALHGFKYCHIVYKRSRKNKRKSIFSLSTKNFH